MAANKRNIRSIDSRFEARNDNDELHIKGYFAVFNKEYRMSETLTESVDPHAFDNALSDDIRCLIDHDARLVLGRTSASTLTLRVDNFGLYGDVTINPKDQDAMNLYARVERGDVSQCSFGFDILKEEYEERGNEYHWTIKAVKLYEVSVCTFPAYEDTSVSARMKDVKDMQKRRTDVFKKNLLKKLKGE